MPGKKPYPEEKLKVKRSVSLPRAVVEAAEASGDTLSAWLTEAGKMRLAQEAQDVQQATAPQKTKRGVSRR